MHQLTGKIRVFEGGRFVEEAPLREVELDYPGLGVAQAWTMGHPEAITFPRRHPTLRRCLVLMTMCRANLRAMRVLRRLVDARLLSVERAATWVERLEGVGKPVKTVGDYVSEMTDERRRLPPLFAVARGRKDRKAASVAAAVLSAPPVGMGARPGCRSLLVSRSWETRELRAELARKARS